MVRGIERRAIFRDEPDRVDFVARLAALAEQGALTVYAWAHLPNHAHPLSRRWHGYEAYLLMPGRGHGKPITCPAAPAWMRFGSSSGSCAPAL